MPLHPAQATDRVLLLARHRESLLFLSASFNDLTRTGFGFVLPQARLAAGEDAFFCAQRALAEQLEVAVPLQALRYVGSVSGTHEDRTRWSPLVQALLPDELRPRRRQVLACPLQSLDALLASGGVAQAESLAALAFYGAKRRAGLLK